AARARRRGSGRREWRGGSRSSARCERQAAAAAAEHEGAERGREGIVAAALVRDGANERDVPRDAVAVRARPELDARRGRAHVVDTEIDGRDAGKLLERARDREPGRVVDQRRDRAPEDDPPARITN